LIAPWPVNSRTGITTREFEETWKLATFCYVEGYWTKGS
jgi:hypothetical protein